MEAIEILTQEQENEILRSPATRNLVREIVESACKRDIVDALSDIELAWQIVNSRYLRFMEE